MLQILGIRTYKKGNSTKKYEAFHEKGWAAPSVQELFADTDKYIEQIPESDRWNVYYTVGHCKEGRGRKLDYQDVIPFDIDHMEEDQVHAAAVVATEALGVPFDKVGICFSGHGVQILIWCTVDIRDTSYFDENRILYKAVCNKIQGALKAAGIKADMDTSVWSAARLMRLPNTYNRKDGMPVVQSYAINKNMEKLNWDLNQVAGLNILPEPEYDVENLARVKKDKDAVLAGCGFLEYCRDNQEEIQEPMWYAMLGVLAYLPDGETLAHEYSHKHPGYSRTETRDKFIQAKSASGPRTCRNICGIWNGCENCSHWGKIASPVLIKGEDFIRTEDTGFRSLVYGKNGDIKQGGISYDDLYLAFKKQYDYVVYNGDIYTWNGQRWNLMEDLEVMGFCEDKAAPPVGIRDRSEFLAKVKSKTKHQRSMDFFEDNARGKLHFQNGTLHLDTMRLTEHRKEYGALHVLPYNYDPTADCPRFKQFIDEVLDHPEDRALLKQYLGYCVSNDACVMQKALFMVGEGANGKSVVIDVLRELVGDNNHCSFTLKELVTGESLHLLHGKLFNAADEGAKRRVLAADIFKNLVTGGVVTARRKYKEKLSFRNTSKLLFASNSNPNMDDADKAIQRRMLILVFRNIFDGDKADRQLINKLKKECPGILNLVLSEYLKVRDSGEFTISEGVREEVRLHHEYGDDVGQYLQETYEFRESGFISRSKLFEEYCGYMASIRCAPVSRQELFGALRRCFPGIRDRKIDTGTRGFLGIDYIKKGEVEI